jgi:hypothetical protein
MMTFRTLAAVALLACGGMANAADYVFSGTAFDGGGNLSGTFSGADLNGNGLISTLDPGGEVRAFSLAFGGDALIPGFGAGLTELVALAWQPGAGPAWGDGIQEGLVVGVSGLTLAGGLAAFGETGVGVADEVSGSMTATRLALQVAVVPEPGTGVLLVLGLGLAALVARRRRR